MYRSIYFLIILLGCGFSSPQNVQEIDSSQLIELKKSDIKVVDIRTKKEYDEGHIPNAINIDFYDSNFIDKMKKLDINEPIIIHCAKGGRSGKASSALKKAGFNSIYDYSGGFSDWKSKRLEIEK